jgi:hypothetical protein
MSSAATSFPGLSSTSVTAGKQDGDATAHDDVPLLPGNPYDVLPREKWLEALVFELQPPDNPRSLTELEQQLKEQLKRQTGLDVDDGEVERYLRARFGASAVNSGGHFLVGTNLLASPPKPPCDLHPEDARPQAAADPALAGQVLVPVKG